MGGGGELNERNVTLVAVALVVLIAGLVAGAEAKPADAAFPGVNGKIAFLTERLPESNPEVYVMDADGGNPTNLTNDGDSDSSPAWSADGVKIAFETARDGNEEVYVMDADGGNPTNLTNNGAQDDTAAWSPDGTEIAFRTLRDGDSEVYVMDADGGNPTNLTT